MTLYSDKGMKKKKRSNYQQIPGPHAALRRTSTAQMNSSQSVGLIQTVRIRSTPVSRSRWVVEFVLVESISLPLSLFALPTNLTIFLVSSLALKEIRLVLSKMLWVYDMELVNKEVDLNRDSTSYVLWSKPDLWVRFVRRPGVQVPILDSE